MRNPQKIVLGVLAAILLLGATPLAAELDGDWAGEGTGSCIVPDPSQITLMYPWQEWKGYVEEGEFRGSWTDEKGYQGGFYGTIIAISPTTAHFQGCWTWYDESAITLMGTFEMDFNYVTEECEGTWERNGSNEGGTMEGERAE